MNGHIGNSPVTVGRFTYDASKILVLEWGEGAALRIGSFCSIANCRIFLGGNHRTDWVSTFPFGHVFQDELGSESQAGHPATKGDVVIGNDVWIGHGAVIMSGVTIGDGAVIAAGSHVVADVPAYCIAGGNPAELIRSRFNGAIVNLLLMLRWWDLEVEQIRKIKGLLNAVPNADVLTELVERYR